MDAVRGLSADPNQSTEELAARYRVTSRHLLRLFETHVGYGPKALARIFRLQRTLSIAGSSRLVFSDLALAAGYSDQSHMYRNFPRYVRNSLQMLCADEVRPLQCPICSRLPDTRWGSLVP